MKKKNKTIMRRTAVFFLILAFLASCATHPDKISSTYVSPLQYQGYNCNQIQAELTRVEMKISELTLKQKKQANQDATAMGVGVCCFWPALFFLAGPDKEEELARLKGEREALERVAIEKECNFALELQKQSKQVPKESLVPGKRGSMNAEDLRKKGDIAKEKGEYENALTYYLESLKIDPHNADSLRAVGLTYYSKNDFQKAEEYLNRAITVKEKWWLPFHELGWLYFDTKRYPEMYNAFEKAIECQDKKYCGNYIGLSGALYILGDKLLAEETMREAIRLAKTSEQKDKLKLYRIHFATASKDYELAKILSTTRPSLGIKFGTTSSNMGVIYIIWEGGIADLAGLKVGDIITEVNGMPLREEKLLTETLQSSGYGHTVTLTVKREGEIIPLRIVLDYDYYLSKEKHEAK